jgi:hypothetical protein
MKKLNFEPAVSAKNKNMIIKPGTIKTRNEEAGKLIQQGIEFLSGEKNHYPPAYSLILEMSGNTIEHAYEDRKQHWLLSLTCDEENKKIIFTFTDNGVGILETLNRKFSDQVNDIFSSEVEVIKNAFLRKYGSSTKEINRNKGLPLIKRMQVEKNVNNLLLITNNVMIDFQSESGEKLSTKFAGTFYYWEIDSNCLKNEKNYQV